MRRSFRLAALLRLRTAEQDRAAAELASASAAALAAAARAERRREELSAHRPPPECTAAAWTASVAARAALVGLHGDAAAAAAAAKDEAERRAELWREARLRTRGLEHLEEKHLERLAKSDRRAEQAFVDDVVNSRAAGRDTPAGHSEGNE